MPDLPNMKYNSDSAVEVMYERNLGSSPWIVAKPAKSVSFDRKHYTHRSNVLRWIPQQYHHAIRSGSVGEDLTGYIHEALNDIFVRGTADPNYSPALYFPAGVYPIGNLKWNGRVALLGEGPGITRLAYHDGNAGSSPPTLIEGSQEAITSAPDAGGKSGVDAFPAAHVHGISDLSLLGHSPVTSPSSMAANLLRFMYLINYGFRLDRVQLGLCTDDAVVSGKEFISLHVDRVHAFGIGGHVFTIGHFERDSNSGELSNPEIVPDGANYPLSIRRFLWENDLSGMSYGQMLWIDRAQAAAISPSSSRSSSTRTPSTNVSLP